MKVYLLKEHTIGHPTDVGMFATYSALVTYLKKNIGEVTGQIGNMDGGVLRLEGTRKLYTYTSYNVIGMHSVKTDQIEFKD